MILTQEQINKIQELGKKGKFAAEIGRIMNLNKTTVAYWLSNREKVKKSNIERYKNKSPQEKRMIYESQKEYQREYHKNRYWSDEVFREKCKKLAREYKKHAK